MCDYFTDTLAASGITEYDYFSMDSQKMQCSSIHMGSQEAANERSVIFMWSGGRMATLLTSEWREMEMVGLLWASPPITQL